MLRFLPAFALLLAFLRAPAQTPQTGNPAELPFTLELEEATRPEIPGLHSFAFAEWQGWWVVIGGRINGLHGFFPFTAFPENGANTSIRLIDPETGDLYSYEVGTLNVRYTDALKSTNPQYAQDGDILYIAGGYGKDNAAGKFVTFPVLTAVKLPELVAKMLAGENPSSAFVQVESPYMEVCGGEMDKMGDYFYLVGGHVFAGNYSQTQSNTFTQTYTYEIRKFKLRVVANTIQILDYSAHRDETNLRRRDFTLAPQIRPDGKPTLCLYGGVFRPNADLPYYNPVLITEDKTFQLDAGYEQVFSQYTCPVVPLFDSLDGSMYTVFFAGLSVHFYNPQTQKVEYDERVPFIRDISTFRRSANGSSREYLMPNRFDQLLGSNMLFVPETRAPHYSNEVFKLRAFQGKTLVGYLFGGIQADIPNITTSRASNRLFKVYIRPKNSVATHQAAAAAPAIALSPNPFTGAAALRIDSTEPIETLQLFLPDGRLLGTFGADAAALERRLLDVPAGVYLVAVNGRMVKVVRG